MSFRSSLISNTICFAIILLLAVRMIVLESRQSIRALLLHCDCFHKSHLLLETCYITDIRSNMMLERRCRIGRISGDHSAIVHKGIHYTRVDKKRVHAEAQMEASEVFRAIESGLTQRLYAWGRKDSQDSKT